MLSKLLDLIIMLFKRGKIVIIPLLITIVLMGSLLIFAQNSVFAPLIYTIF
jgi:hypothetical protein